MHEHATVKGSIAFRLKWELNDRRETVTLGKYHELSLARDREKCIDASRAIGEGRSPRAVVERPRPCRRYRREVIS